MPIIVPIPRAERRLMQKSIHKSRGKDHARRLTAMLMLQRGERVSDFARISVTTPVVGPFVYSAGC